jgi:hypothetical protein
MKAILRACPLKIWDEAWVRAHLVGISAADSDPRCRRHWDILVSLLVTLRRHSEPASPGGRAVRRWLRAAHRDGRLSDRHLLNLSQMTRITP